MKVTSKINPMHMKSMQHIFRQAQIKTCDAMKTDLQHSQTMPFDTGALQNTKTFVDDKNVKKGVVRIVSEGPYARRLYFHPEYNFQKTNNPKAGGMWFSPYISGNKKKMPMVLMAKFVREGMQNELK